MRKVLVLGGSYLQSDFISTALEMGYEVIVLDKNDTCFASGIPKVQFLCVDISDVNAVEKVFLDNKCDLIISPVTEIGNKVAAKIASNQGLIYNSLDAVKATTDKHYMREKLKHHNINEPKTEAFVSKEKVLKEFNYPFIVKPSVSSASRGVTLVRSEREFGLAIDEAMQFCTNASDILIEEYMAGDQYSIETVSSQGKHHVLAITREILSGAPHFMERMDIISVEENLEMHPRVQSYVEDLLEALGVTVGPCHIEVKIENKNIRLIEVASRSGLLRDRLLRCSNAANYNELILKAYSGKTIDKEDIKLPEINAYLGIIAYQDDFKVYLECKKDGLLWDDYFNDNPMSLKPKRLTDAVGYFFANSKQISDLIKYRLKL